MLEFSTFAIRSPTRAAGRASSHTRRYRSGLGMHDRRA